MSSKKKKVEAFVPLAELHGYKVRKESGWGIASLVLALLPFAIPLVLALLLVFYIKYGSPTDAELEQTFDHMIVPFAVMLVGTLIAVPLALVFGVVSLFQKAKDKTCGVAGRVIVSFWMCLFLLNLAFPS